MTRKKRPERKEASMRREVVAIEMRLTGMSMAEIGEALGVTRQRATQIIDGALERAVIEPAEKLKRRQLDRVERLMRAIWPTAIDMNHPDQHKAILSFERLASREAKLAGLDAPIKFVPTETTQEKADRLADELAAYQAGVADALAMTAEREEAE